MLITESVPKPLDDIVIDFLLSQKRETAEIDFKLFINVSRRAEFAKIAKDIFAMSNYCGGYLVIGFQETATGRFEPLGLPEDFHIEQASLQEKFNSYSNEPLALDYAEVEKEIEGHKKKFAILYVPPAPVVLKPIKYATYFDEKRQRERKLFSRDEILIRRGTQSVHASLNEIKYIEKRSKQTEYRTSLLSGESDTVVENLYGNFFRVIGWPKFIFEAQIPQKIRFSHSETRAKPYVRPKGSKKIYSFCNLDGDPFGKYLIKDSMVKCKAKDFLNAEAKRKVLIWLLNTEIRYVTLEKKLKYAGKKKNLFYYPSETQERYETWDGRFRKTRKRVAFKTCIPKTGETVYAHNAASMRFQFIGDNLYLTILPKIVTTLNGYETTRGPD